MARNGRPLSVNSCSRYYIGYLHYDNCQFPCRYFDEPQFGKHATTQHRSFSTV
jgi:hypothetical protein